MKKVFYYIIVAAAAFLAQMTCARASVTQESLFGAFYETGAVIKSAVIDVRGTYKGEFVYEDKKEEMVDYICSSVPVDEEDISCGWSQDSFYINISTNIDMSTEVDMSEDGKKQEEVAKEKAKNIVNLKKDMLSTLKKMNMTADACITIRGEFEGRLTRQSMENVMQSVYSYLMARGGGLNSISDNGTTWVSYGYSDELPDRVTTGGQCINVSGEFIYDEVTDVTNFYLATPIINP